MIERKRERGEREGGRGLSNGPRGHQREGCDNCHPLHCIAPSIIVLYPYTVVGQNASMHNGLNS